ncbi:hypothetical protein COO60DRAFT_1639651 [Scenedesmus sp. NREL 46B-D3]|nr:hypothetical protein COO60DRAFT_1639651 [Scenedesmus sp. NREL 46B-D3]
MAMDPDHPMLQRAQQALSRQLNAKRMRVEGELRTKQTALSRAKKQREEVGVELYGFQQNLAKLQMSLEKAQDNYQALSSMRVQAEQELGQLRGNLQDQQSLTKQEAQRIEAYNESMKSEIVVTRRAAYAAEDAMQKLEKEKQHQDYLIDDMQENMKSLQQQLALYTAQLTAQRRETRAAKETLAEAEREMEGVHFEKKQLLAQWKGSLTAIQRRDEALAAVQDSIRAQQQQELAIGTEIQGYKKDINKEQIKNEQLSVIVRKVQGESEYVLKQAAASVEKQERLAALLAKLSRSLEHTEERMRRSQLEGQAVMTEAESVERATQRVFAELRALESDMLHTLSEQTSAEKSSFKTAADIRALRAASEAEELRIAEVQNELARLGVDVLNTQGHNERLQQALDMLDAELKDKDASIVKYEVELKRRGDEIERKTRETDALNRKLEKLLAAQPEAINTGPLEATIHNMGKDIEAKGREGQELQRRWITRQTELVALQAENNGLTEALARYKAEVTVLTQKRSRAERALAGQLQEAKALRTAAGRLQVDLGRVNALIAQHAGLKALLQEEQLQLEGRALCELRSLEETSAALSSAIQEGQLAKQQLVDDMLEAERQIMLAERKIQLEREMQEMLDPSVGEGVVAAMKREVHRMELRHAELLRTQERLMQELEKALSKHEIIGVKALAQKTKASPSSSSSGSPGRNSPAARSSTCSSPGSASSSSASRAIAEFKRGIRETEAEAAATQQRLKQLRDSKAQLEAATGGAAAAWHQLQQEQAQLRAETAQAQAASQLQRIAKGLEDAAAGRYKRQVEASTAAGQQQQGGTDAGAASSSAQLQAAFVRASDRQAQLVAVLQQLRQQAPDLQEQFNGVLAHAAAAETWLETDGLSSGAAVAAH